MANVPPWRVRWSQKLKVSTYPVLLTLGVRTDWTVGVNPVHKPRRFDVSARIFTPQNRRFTPKNKNLFELQGDNKF